MEVRYDPALAEEVVLLACRAREEAGDDTLTDLYHARTRRLYDLPPEEREEAFRRFHVDFFREQGLGRDFEPLLGEHADLCGRIGTLHATRAVESEEANLMRAPSARSGFPSVRIRVLPERFADTNTLRRILLHEMAHLSDMLDPAFGYETEIAAANPAEETFIRDRYRILWDIRIDSRLAGEGRGTVADREARCREFEVLYRKFPPSERRAVFEALWSGERRWTHAELLDLARKPESLLALAGSIEGAAAPAKVRLPGALCPLCRFPTHQWAEEMEGDEEIASHIRADFPEWTPEDGCCGHCLEGYLVRAGRW
jgi:hypothetical protein